MKKFIYIFLILTIAGCSFAPKYQRPNMELPDSFGTSASGGNIAEAQWWEYFDSETLNSLVEEALKYNRDIAVAAARVEQASAMFSGARSSLFPSLDAKADGGETWVRGHKVQGSSMPFSAGFYATWEIDLFGKYRNAADSAKAQLLANEASWRGVMLSVIGQTVSGYYTLKSLDLQLRIAESTVESREKSVAIYQERYDMGLISRLDLAQMKSSLETARTALYKTRISRDKADAAMLLLLGRSPKSIMEDSVKSGTDLEKVAVKPIIPAGLPSKLLERRPDIKAAEQNLISANADIGTAKAAWFPNISLTGMFGVVSQEFTKLFTNPMMAWNYGASVGMPLLNFGKIKSGVDSAEAKKKEAFINYEKTVQNAFGDLRNALTAQEGLQKVVSSLSVMRSELSKAYELVTLQYDKGYVSYLDVLDTERNLFQAELDLASARSDYISAVVSVCMALGGGWYDVGEGEKNQ